jgi:hypothetical protein
VCAFVISSAVFLILELDQPFGGVIQFSSAPLRNARRLANAAGASLRTAPRRSPAPRGFFLALPLSPGSNLRHT